MNSNVLSESHRLGNKARPAGNGWPLPKGATPWPGLWLSPNITKVFEGFGVRLTDCVALAGLIQIRRRNRALPANLTPNLSTLLFNQSFPSLMQTV